MYRDQSLEAHGNIYFFGGNDGVFYTKKGIFRSLREYGEPDSQFADPATLTLPVHQRSMYQRARSSPSPGEFFRNHDGVTVID